MVGQKIYKNPFLLFAPLLVLFVLITLVVHDDAMESDEGRYYYFAENLYNGYYSPPPPDINLWCGPGFPIILIPFVALKLPLISITLFNAILMYLSVVLLYKSAIKFVSYPLTLFFSFFWAFCYSAYKYISLIHTEIFTAFLIMLLTYFSVLAFESKTSSKRYLILGGLILGFIALTKIIFGYVLVVLLIGSIMLFLISENKVNLKKTLFILLVAFLTVSPYLLYTYNLTGRAYYWGNSGGMSLYWMSTPHEMEYGDWNNETYTAVIDAEISGGPAILKKTHQKDADEIAKYTGVEKDDAYKRIAIQNIKSNPTKFLKNIISNISRSFFGFPFTYSYQRPLIKVWYSSILFTLILVSMILTIINWKKIDFSIRFLLFTVSIYYGGSTLLSMDIRQLVVIIPLLLFWIAYTLQKSLTLKIKFDNKTV